MKKFDDQFLAKTNKYLPNFYIVEVFEWQERVWECLGTINQQASLPRSVQHTY